MSEARNSTATRRWLTIGALLLAFGGAGFGIGRYQGALVLDSETERFQRDRLALQNQVEQAGAQVESCRAERDLLAARKSLSLLARALERRNFGTAEAYREQALDELASARLGAVTGIVAVAQRVRQLSLAVDPDPDAPIAEVLGIIEELDRTSGAPEK